MKLNPFIKRIFYILAISSFSLTGCSSSPLIDETETRKSLGGHLVCSDQDPNATLSGIMRHIHSCFPPKVMLPSGQKHVLYQYNDFSYRTNHTNDYTVIWSRSSAHSSHFIDPREFYIDIKPGSLGCDTQVLLITTKLMAETLRKPIQNWAKDQPYKCRE